MKQLVNIRNKIVLKIKLIFILSYAFVFSLNAQEYTESEVKAGYLYNFTKFVAWPESAFQTAPLP